MGNAFLGSVRLALTGAFIFTMTETHGAAVARIGGDVAVTAPFDGLCTAFGLWEAGEGCEHFRHGRKFGKAANGQLVWDMNQKGMVFVVH